MRIKYFFLLLGLVGIPQLSPAMEKSITRSITKNHASAFTPFPDELIYFIALFLIHEYSQLTEIENLNAATNNLKKFAWVILQDRRTLNLLDATEGNIKFILNRFSERFNKESPFFILNRLRIKNLSDELNDHYTDQALTTVMHDLNISLPQLTEWLHSCSDKTNFFSDGRSYESHMFDDEDNRALLTFVSLGLDLNKTPQNYLTSYLILVKPYKPFPETATTKLSLYAKITLLLKLGINPNTALFRESHANNHEEVKLLFDAGANPNTLYSLKLYDTRRVPYYYITTILHDAAYKVGRKNQTDLQLIQMILDAGGNPNIVDSKKMTPLSRAAESPSLQSNTLQGMRLLLQAGANPDIDQPIFKLIDRNSRTGLQLLLEYGANQYIKDELGYTPFVRALMKKNYDAINVLLTPFAQLTYHLQ